MAPGLPFDIVRMVQDKLFVPEDHSLWHLYGMVGRRAWLAQTLTISRSWYENCLPFLYQVIEIAPTDETTLDLLLRTLRRRPGYAAHVRMLRPYDRPRRKTRRLLPGETYQGNKRSQMMDAVFRARNRRSNLRWIRKFVALARLCTNIEEVQIGSGTVRDLTPVLTLVETRLQRLVIKGNCLYDMATLCKTVHWSSLRSLTLGTFRPFLLEQIPQEYNLSSFHASLFAKMSNLVELQLLGRVEPDQLHDVLYAVRRTLRSFTCFQVTPRDTPATWLAPVKNTLRKLSLYVRSTRICDITSLVSLKELRILVQCREMEMPQDIFALGSPAGFPPVQHVEWTFFDPLVTPTIAEEFIRGLLVAADHGYVPGLLTVAVNLVLGFSMRTAERSWSGFDSRLRLQCAERGLDFRLETAHDCSIFLKNDSRDIFAFLAYTNEQEREMRRLNREMRRRSAGCMRRRLARTGEFVVSAWTRCCDVACMCWWYCTTC